VETGAGVLEVEWKVEGRSGKVESVRVDMGKPRL
jgi:hypothetical protein